MQGKTLGKMVKPQIVELVLRRYHLLEQCAGVPTMHAAAIAATEARLPGAQVVRGVLYLQLGKVIEEYILPVDVLRFCSGLSCAEEVVWPIPVPQAFVEAVWK